MPVTVSRAGTANQKLQQLDAGVRAGITAAGRYYIIRVRRTIELFAPRGRATGKMIRSLTVSPVVVINGIYRARAGPTVDYAWWVNQGTGPAAGHGPRKWPPRQAIYEWIKEKGLVPTFTMVQNRSKTTGRFMSGLHKKAVRRADVERDRRTLAFLIARKIGTKGTKPFPFMTATFKAIHADMKQIIIGYILRALRSTS